MSTLVRSMETMTASSPRDRPLSPRPNPRSEPRPAPRSAPLSAALSASALAPSAGPSAAETVRFPTAAAYAAALEAQAAAEAPVSLHELRSLLEENLTALRAVYEDQRRTIASALRNVETAREELRALGQPEAPWIEALDQTRALIRGAFAEIATKHAAAAPHRR